MSDLGSWILCDRLSLNRHIFTVAQINSDWPTENCVCVLDFVGIRSPQLGAVRLHSVAYAPTHPLPEAAQTVFNKILQALPCSSFNGELNQLASQVIPTKNQMFCLASLLLLLLRPHLLPSNQLSRPNPGGARGCPSDRPIRAQLIL